MTAIAMMIATGSGVDRVAVIGGGINGAGIAWELARRGYEVVLFEKGEFGKQTSSATTKMIHGGLRYLENFQIGLVRESLRERGWLLELYFGQPRKARQPVFATRPPSCSPPTRTVA
jgi:glycerol-3-phosphate dehydrogenase